jgi:hypothetical protein
MGAGDAIELRDIDGASASMNYAAGVLSVADGTHSTSIAMEGDSFDWAKLGLATDDKGHAVVTYDWHLG